LPLPAPEDDEPAGRVDPGDDVEPFLEGGGDDRSLLCGAAAFKLAFEPAFTDGAVKRRDNSMVSNKYKIAYQWKTREKRNANKI
jgi:hypothetical protein